MTNQEKLLSAFKEDRFEDFEELLECRDIDVDYFYGDPDNGTLLDLATRSPEFEHEKYISKLIRTGAKIWRQDEETGKIQIHEIFNNTKRYSLHNIWNDVYVLSGSGTDNGNIMKVAVEENDFEAITILARSYSRVHSVHFRPGPDAQNMILLEGSIDAVRLFIKYFDVDKEFQRDTQGRPVTCREVILQKYPELEGELPVRSPSELQEILFSYLEKGVPELFVKRIADVSAEILNEGKQKKSTKTYLHVACERNYIDVVEALLKKNVNLNEIAYFYEFAQNLTPIMLAASLGHHEIFEKLALISEVELQYAEGSGSVWHVVLRSMQFMQNLDGSTEGHRKILELLPELSQFVDRLSTEHTDKSNRTALHYALKYNNEFAIKLLLGAGAKLYPKDQSILTTISATIIESYFDDCIRSERDHTRMRDAEDNLIIFDYKIFKQLDLYSIATKSRGNFFTKFDSVTEMRQLYKHPLAKSFLYLKWCLVKKYYYLNLVFYTSFCLALNTYIFLIQDCVSSLVNFNSSGSTNSSIERDASSIPCDVSLWTWLVTFLLYVVLILRELCQFSASIRRYFGIPENWFEMAMIVVIGFLFANKTNTHLAASAILMSWIGLILLLGKQPSIAIYIEMFKTVALNFAKFLLLYSILIASFAYSFFILFRNKTSGHVASLNQTHENTIDRMYKNSLNLWQDLPMSFFKSIFMMTNGFDVSTLPLDSRFSYGHVFLILFVFLVTMVLYNLLLGLAVSDTRAIMGDAEIVALISRAKLIWRIERLAISNPFRSAFKCRTGKQREREYVFLRNKSFGDVEMHTDETNPVYETNRVYVNPTESNRIEINGKNFGNMPSNIVKHAEEILEKRRQSKLAKNDIRNSLADAEKNNSTEHRFVSELVHEFSEQMSNLKLEIDAKNAARDEKLLQHVDQRFDQMMIKLIDVVLREVILLKNKDQPSETREESKG
ncbi:transient receptor potential cation channel protein painless-like isoform X2 [Planococcus citri]|uniref:transient receptor potential cation channel protein painless-like isoform X2 n=1 Tax=Planococcus citri TaxID=170843 RepID=UPI0031F971BC